MQRLLHGTVVLLHALVMILGLSIPVVLALHTLFGDAGFEPRVWLRVADYLPRWKTLLSATMQVGIPAVVIATLGGAVCGFLAFKTRWPGRMILVFAILALVCTPSFVTATAILSLTGLEASFGSALIAGVVQGLMYVPLATMIIGLGLMLVNPELEETALMDLEPHRVVCHISLPAAAWSVIVCAFVIFVLVITDYSVTDLLNVDTFAREIFIQFQLEGQRARPFLTTVPVMILLGSVFLFLKRYFSGPARPLFQGPDRRPFLMSLNLWQRWCAWLLTAVLLGGALAAFGRLLLPLRSWQRFLQTYQSFAGDWPRTVLVALLTGGILALLSLTFGWAFARSRRWRVPTGAMLLGLVSVPAPALAMTLIWYFNRATPPWLMSVLGWFGVQQDPFDVLYLSSAKYVLAIGLRFLPIAVLFVLPAIYRVPKDLLDATHIDGLPPLTALRRIYLPEGRVNVLLCALVVMVLTVGELDCAYLVAPPDKPTLSVRFFTFVHFGLDHQVATLCLAATLTNLVPAAAIFLIGKNRLLGEERFLGFTA